MQLNKKKEGKSCIAGANYAAKEVYKFCLKSDRFCLKVIILWEITKLGKTQPWWLGGRALV